jgi:uncharacterized protein
MKLPVDDISQTPKEIKFSESVEELNEIWTKNGAWDFRAPPFLDVSLVHYRSGREVFFQGRLEGTFVASCSRCQNPYSFALGREFEYVLVPEATPSERRGEKSHRENPGVNTYSNAEIDLAPLVMEQVILALPTRPLCAEGCRGLCGGCGVDLNTETCRCQAGAGDPRMAIFRTLKVGR